MPHKLKATVVFYFESDDPAEVMQAQYDSGEYELDDLRGVADRITVVITEEG